MAEQRSVKLSSLAVTVASAAASLPVPSGAPLQAVLDAFEAWESGTYTPKFATVSIDAAGAGSISAGATLYGWDATDGIQRAIATLNGGAAIALTATVGYEERLNDVAFFDALTVSGTVVGTTVTVKFTPIETAG